MTLVSGADYVIAKYAVSARGVSEEAGDGQFTLTCVAGSVPPLSDMMRGADRNDAGEASDNDAELLRATTYTRSHK